MNRFDLMYESTPPWEIGRPQSAVIELWRAGQLAGRLLDVGCGTGENALLSAGNGGQVLGVDGAPRAIESRSAMFARVPTPAAKRRVDAGKRRIRSRSDLGAISPTEGCPSPM